MEVIQKVIKHGRKTKISLFPLGDIHCGTKHCAEEEIKAQVKEIRSMDNAYWIGMGDYGEFISPSDPRWNIGVIAKWVDEDNIAEDQTDWIVELLKPIKDKCIGLLEGNHEDAIRTHSHIDVQKNLCKRLEVPNLGYSCWVCLDFRRSQTTRHLIKGVFTHGAGWAITKGAKLNRLERFMDAFNARIYGYAHMHDIITDSKAYLDLDDRGIIKQREKVGAVTGCWFKTYTQGIRASYGEKRSYPPTALGCPRFVITPDESKVEVQD